MKVAAIAAAILLPFAAVAQDPTSASEPTTTLTSTEIMTTTITLKRIVATETMSFANSTGPTATLSVATTTKPTPTPTTGAASSLHAAQAAAFGLVGVVAAALL